MSKLKDYLEKVYNEREVDLLKPKGAMIGDTLEIPIQVTIAENTNQMKSLGLKLKLNKDEFKTDGKNIEVLPKETVFQKLTNVIASEIPAVKNNKDKFQKTLSQVIGGGFKVLDVIEFNVAQDGGGVTLNQKAKV